MTAEPIAMHPAGAARTASRIRRLAVIFGKLALGAVLVACLLRRQDFGWPAVRVMVSRLLTQPFWPLLALLLVLGCLMAGAARWRAALTSLGLPLSRGRTAVIFMIGHFFNGFLPGTTGGDVVRALYAARETPGRGPEAVMSIAVERLMGVAVLLVLAIGGLAISPAHRHQRLALALLGLLAGAILLLLLALPDPRHLRAWPLLGRLGRHPLAKRFYDALRLCRTRPRLLVRLLGWSFLQHGCAVASWLAMAAGLAGDFKIASCAALVPAVLVAQMVPVTPGGLGIRENAAVALLPAAGLTPAGAMLLALASYAASLIWSAAGGLLFLLVRHTTPHTSSPPGHDSL